jgi:hypothetical protein
VVWQGSAGDRRPYADLTRHSDIGHLPRTKRPDSVTCHPERSCQALR